VREEAARSLSRFSRRNHADDQIRMHLHLLSNFAAAECPLCEPTLKSI
jgi:hypothetical protein